MNYIIFKHKYNLNCKIMDGLHRNSVIGYDCIIVNVL